MIQDLGEILSARTGILNTRQEIVSESTKNIRTVASLQCEAAILEGFDEKLEAPVKNQFKKSMSVGLAMSMADAILFFAYAACFWLGGYLIYNEARIKIFQVFKDNIKGVENAQGAFLRASQTKIFDLSHFFNYFSAVEIAGISLRGFTTPSLIFLSKVLVKTFRENYYFTSKYVVGYAAGRRALRTLVVFVAKRI